MPRRRDLTALVRWKLVPDEAVLQNILSVTYLAVGDASGQETLDQLVAIDKSLKSKRVREAATLADRMLSGERFDEPTDEGFVFHLRDPKLLAELQKRGKKVAGDVSQNMLKELRDVLSKKFYAEGQHPHKLVQDIKSIFPETYKNRAENIARTEVGIAQSKIRHETLLNNGVESSQWLTMLDGRERPSHEAANGQVRPIGVPFSVGSSKLQYPKDPAGPPEEICRCRCNELPVIDDDWELPDQPWNGGEPLVTGELLSVPTTTPITADPAAKMAPLPKTERPTWRPTMTKSEADVADPFFGRGEYQCARCIHQTEGSLLVCKAFPEGKPIPLCDGSWDHTHPFPGDNGIRFEVRTKEI